MKANPVIPSPISIAIMYTISLEPWKHMVKPIAMKMAPKYGATMFKYCMIGTY